MYGGLVLSVLLIIFSPVMSGSETSMIPGVNFAWFPLSNPGIVTIPVSFLLGWLGSMGGAPEDTLKQSEMEVRSLTGVGAEGAIGH